MSKSQVLAAIEALREAGDTESFQEMDLEDAQSTMFSGDADIAVEIDGTPWVAQKIAAMRAYPTQIAADGPFFAGAEVLGDGRWAREYYRLAVGVPLPEGEGWAVDLFAGLS
jgi:N-acetyl-1-D-myo-inositol-2-amino-2-deoxy-alpha-D-glucopyranoside deacetylase